MASPNFTSTFPHVIGSNGGRLVVTFADTFTKETLDLTKLTTSVADSSDTELTEGDWELISEGPLVYAKTISYSTASDTAHTVRAIYDLALGAGSQGVVHTFYRRDPSIALTAEDAPIVDENTEVITGDGNIGLSATVTGLPSFESDDSGVTISIVDEDGIQTHSTGTVAHDGSGVFSKRCPLAMKELTRSRLNSITYHRHSKPSLQEVLHLQLRPRIF